MRRPFTMWWVLILLSLMTVIRVFALACAPPPMEVPAGLTLATPRATWGPSWGSLFFGLLSDYSDAVVRSGHLTVVLVIEFCYVLFYLFCAQSGFSGREFGMKAGFLAALLQDALLAALAGFPWALLQFFPTLLVGLGWSNGPQAEEEAQ